MTSPDVTSLLHAWGEGDQAARDQLIPVVYDELRRRAAVYLRHERRDHTLQPTALVHEAYLRLVDTDKSQRWDSRGHFFGAAAEAMRRILVDNARRKRRPKHGGDLERVDLEEAVAVIPSPATDLLALDEALTKLAAQEPVKAELVKLRFFAGLTIPQAAQVLGISDATAERYWTYARVWLYSELEGEGQDRPIRKEPKPL